MKTNENGLLLIDMFLDEYDATESRTAAEKALNLYVKVRLNRNQFSALVSLVMYMGIEAFSKSKMLGLINASKDSRDLLLKAADEFGKYIYEIDENDKRVVDQFLISQRDMEKALFLTPEIVPKRKRK